MSAPPSCVDDAPVMPTMVSRLPKFGSRTKSTTSASSGAQTVPTPTANAATFTGATASSTRLTNGFYHHPGPAGVNGGVTAPSASAKQNGFIRVPTSFSVKWRKENGMTTDDGGANAEPEWRGGRDGNVGQNRPGNNINQYYYQRQQASPVVSQHDTKKTTASSAGMGRGFGQSVSSSSSPSPQSSPRTLPVSKSGTLGSKPSPTASRLTNGTKQALNALPGSRSGTSGSLSRPQSFPRPGGPGPGSRTGSPFQKKPPASRSLSSDSIGSAPTVRLMESDRFRSRSLNQVRQQPSLLRSPSSSSSSSLPRSPTVTRPYSVTRPAVRGPAQAPPTGRQTPEGGGGGVKASGRSGLVPPSALKKPLLPNLGPASKPSGISYKLSRPSLIKQARPFRVTPARVSGGDPDVNLGATSAERPPATGNSSAESSPEAPETEGLPTEPVAQAEVSILGETLEDMSLSSTSSLDRDDTSQEYMDDFDNLGIGDIGIMLLPSKNDEDDSGLDQSCARFDKLAVNGVAEATGLCFLEDGLDWAGVQLSGEGAEHRLTQLGCRRRTSHQEYHEQGGSSLDLSPSDSCGSGGTYMWDEEGLEPLGGAVTTASINTTNSSTTHHIGSFDSDVNSIDMMNNLDSCDLEDDDLMLDAEDVSLDSDGDRTSNMAQWRMRQLCWGTQDVHTDHESDLQCYKLTEDPGNKRTDGDFVLDLCPSRTPCLPPALGLDVEELADDCSAVRSQLEHLQRLLLQEDDVDEDTLTTDTLSPEAEDSSHSSDSQVQALLQEVQQLREDLRSRDRTIAQLTLQLTFPTVTARCRCQETTGRMDRHTQMSVTERESVASQTPWTEHKTAPPVPLLSPPWQYQRSRPYRGRPRPGLPSHLARKITDISLLRPGKPGTTDGPSPAATAACPSSASSTSSAFSPPLP
ncbi:serine-rich coiled-coil domain-containing protein 2 isoform X4 [Scophthalmus maximus]|uniref:serine-rich coiled-coil domain-containing protein 2 isoform X4 n=1 Tax=Scophthalmus maximus TaxID=52904 RepID=UPI001FA8C76E|nr:serine-rich coiled-coil domain-containing protein 2 isoform X4 [Scophthalmus maximus]